MRGNSTGISPARVSGREQAPNVQLPVTVNDRASTPSAGGLLRAVVRRRGAGGRCAAGQLSSPGVQSALLSKSEKACKERRTFPGDAVKQ
jgi:hypothetical protein